MSIRPSDPSARERRYSILETTSISNVSSGTRLDCIPSGLLSCSGMAININKQDTLDSMLVEFTGGAAGVELVAAMLDRDGRLPDRGMLVWSGQRVSSDGALRLIGSELDGARLSVDLPRVTGTVGEIALCLTTGSTAPRNGNGLRVRLVDEARSRMLAHLTAILSEQVPTREIGRLARAGAGWRFVETGRDYSDGLDVLLRRYGIGAGTISAGAAPAPDARFLELIAESFPTRYCDAAERLALLGQGMRLGLDADMAETVLDLELERRGVANESALLARLDAVLRRFTDKDRKLDDKERRDALQLVCRTEHGFGQGLRHDVADQYVTRFCRERGVKVKVGLLRWAVP